MDLSGSVIFDVDPFGFGAHTMALSLAKHLQPHRPLVCMARGGTVEPMRSSGLFTAVHDVSRRSPAALLARLLARGHLAAVCDFGGYDSETWGACADSRVPCLCIDPHLWRRTRSRIRSLLAPSRARHIWCSAYPGIDEDLRRVGLDNRRLVPPLVGEMGAPSRRKSGRIIINLGGCDSSYLPCGINAYPEIMLRVLSAALAELDSDQDVLVCCGEKAARHLRENIEDLPFPVSYLPRCDYLADLSAASLLITQPSMQSPYEGFLCGVPTILLPPQNFTQFFHLWQWRSWAIGWPGTHLAELDPGMRLSPTREERPQEMRVQRFWESMRNEPQLVARLVALYTRYIGEVLFRPDPLLSSQRQACERLGLDRGAELAGRLVLAHCA